MIALQVTRLASGCGTSFRASGRRRLRSRAVAGRDALPFMGLPPDAILPILGFGIAARSERLHSSVRRRAEGESEL